MKLCHTQNIDTLVREDGSLEGISNKNKSSPAGRRWQEKESDESP